MSIRTIVFTVEETGEVSPALPQYAGVQGDHNATTVRFDLPDALYDAKWKYRIEYVNGNGCFDSTVFIDPEFIVDKNRCVRTDLPSIWTESGGVAEIRLCAFEEDSGMEMFSAVGRLSFKSRETDGGVIGENSISALIIAADAAREIAQDSAEEARRRKEESAAAAKAAQAAQADAEKAATQAGGHEHEAYISESNAKRHAEEAKAARDRAETYAGQALDSQMLTNGLQESAQRASETAQSAATSAETFRDEAAMSAKEAYNSELATQESKEKAEAAQTAAEAAKTTAVQAAQGAGWSATTAGNAATTCTDILAQVEELTGITAEIKATLGVE